MYAGVVGVKALSDYVLLLSFDNCEERLFDMKPLLSMGRFSELKDAAEFNSVFVSFDTIQWANGLELDPEYIQRKYPLPYGRLKKSLSISN